MDLPYLSLPKSSANKTSRIISIIGFVLYTIYLGFFSIGVTLSSLDLTLSLIIGLVIILVVDLLLPLYSLQKIYKRDITSYKTLYSFIPVTLTSIGVIYLAPLAIFNVGLAVYVYMLYSRPESFLGSNKTDRPDDTQTGSNYDLTEVHDLDPYGWTVLNVNSKRVTLMDDTDIVVDARQNTTLKTYIPLIKPHTPTWEIEFSKSSTRETQEIQNYTNKQEALQALQEHLEENPIEP